MDLHPAHLFPGDARSSSWSNGIASNQQVGAGLAGGGPAHALLWRGTAESAVDLHPPGFASSWAAGTDGEQQAGFGRLADVPQSESHALLWSGTSESAVDLHPTGWAGALVGSGAFGVRGGQQVGRATMREPDGSGTGHAILWRGTAESAIDLHPTQLGFLGSTAMATNGVQQVGDGFYQYEHGVGVHAVLWEGTAESAVDLHAFLPPGWEWSHATGIDSHGNVVGYVGGEAGFHAVRWVVQVPEPAAALPLLATLAAAGSRRRR